MSAPVSPAPIANPPADQVRALLCTTLMATLWLVRQSAPLASAILLRVFDDIILFAFALDAASVPGYFALKQTEPGTLHLQRIDTNQTPIGFMPDDELLRLSLAQAYSGLTRANGQEPVPPNASVLPASLVLH